VFLGAQPVRHAAGSVQFDTVSLAIIKGERVTGKVSLSGHCKACGRIQATTEQADRFQLGVHRVFHFSVRKIPLIGKAETETVAGPNLLDRRGDRKYLSSTAQ
jgi:hypothetical protein